MSTHSECANFNNGWCMRHDKAVNPGGAACPDFTPKNLGLFTSDDVDYRTKYKETIHTKKPKVPVEKKTQRQREVRIGGQR